MSRNGATKEKCSPHPLRSLGVGVGRKVLIPERGGARTGQGAKAGLEARVGAEAEEGEAGVEVGVGKET